MRLFSGLFKHQKQLSKKGDQLPLKAVSDPQIMPVPQGSPTDKKQAATEENSETLSKKEIHQSLSTLAQQLQIYEETKPIGEELDIAIAESSLPRAVLFKLLDRLIVLAKVEANKIPLKQQYMDQISALQKILNNSSPTSFERFESLLVDFPMLSTEVSLLQFLHRHLPSLLAEEELAPIYDGYLSCAERFQMASAKVVTLKAEQAILTTEIEKYTKTVQECAQKYRLSIDWEGKKPLMVSLGKKLSEKREASLQQELLLNQEIEALYQHYPYLHQQLTEQYSYLRYHLTQQAELLQDGNLQAKRFEEMAKTLEQLLRTLL